MNSGLILIIAVIAFFLASILIPLIIRIDHILGIYSISSLRDLHTGKKPTAGGLVFYICFLIVVVLVEILFDLPYPSLYIISLSTLAVTIGLIDDIWGIPPVLKFIFITLVCAVFIAFDVYARSIIYPIGLVLELGNIGIILSAVLFFMIINGYNFLDGMDGLAASTAIIILSGTIIINIFQEQFWLNYLTVPMIAILLAFLRFNWYPSKIFMGDTGSLFLGVFISFVVFKTFTSEFSLLIFPMMLFLSIPLGEFLLSFMRRMHAGISPVQADKEHFHHKLLQFGLTQTQALIIILFLVTFSVLLGIYVFIFHNSLSILFSTIFFFLLLSIIIRLGYFNLYNQTIIIKPPGSSVQSITSPVPFKFESFIHKIILILADAIMVNLGFTLFLIIKRKVITASLYFTPSFELFLLLTMFWITIFFLFNLYSMPWDYSIFFKLQRVVKAILAGILIIGLLAFDTDRGLTTAQIQSLFIYGFFLTLCVAFGRLTIIYTEGHFKVLEYGIKNTILLISGKNQLDLILRKIERPGLLHKVIGYVTVSRKKGYENVNIEFLGTLNNLKQIIRNHQIDEIILGEFPKKADEFNTLLSECVGSPIAIKIIPAGSLTNWKRNISLVSDYPFIRIFNFTPMNWQMLIKRFIDFSGGLILLLVGFPFFLSCFIRKLNSGGRIFAREEGLGFKGKKLKMTYLDTDSESGNKIMRICQYYPVLYLLLKGDLSLVGLKPRTQEWYSENEKIVPYVYQRLLVKPGLICYADVWSGKEKKKVQEEVEQDLYYINNFSLTLDLRIILRAILKLLG